MRLYSDWHCVWFQLDTQWISFGSRRRESEAKSARIFSHVLFELVPVFVGKSVPASSSEKIFNLPTCRTVITKEVCCIYQKQIGKRILGVWRIEVIDTWLIYV